jgi:putative ABC transport system permease protein
MNTPWLYHGQLVIRSFRRAPWLTLSIVLTLGLGIGTSMTAASLLHILSADPIPTKSSKLFQPQRVYLDQTHSQFGTVGYSEASALIGARAEDGRGTILAEGFGTVSESSTGREHPSTFVLHTTRSFFPLFEVPFSEGSAWTANDDMEGNHVAVLSQAFARSTFGNLASALGRSFRYGGRIFVVVGVLAPWRQTPRVYNLNFGGAFIQADDVYVPIKAVRDLGSDVFLPFDCDVDPDSSKDAAAFLGHNDQLLNSACAWTSMWVELRNHTELDWFQAQLAEHSSANVKYKLSSVRAILRDSGIVTTDVEVYSLLGVGFLVLCVLSASGALLGKFLRQGFETGLRRAVGASRHDIQFQFLTEALVMGILGGMLGLLLTFIGLDRVRHLQTSFSDVIHFDSTMFAMTILVAIFSGLLAGFLPAWRAARVPPGLQIRT